MSDHTPKQLRATQTHSKATLESGASIEQRVTSVAFTENGLPPPDDFLKYGQVLESAPERILAMAEREQTNRHEKVRVDNRMKFLGMLFAFLIMVVFLFGVGWLLYIQRPLEGLGALVLAMATVIGLFVYAKKHPVATAPAKSDGPSSKLGPE